MKRGGVVENLTNETGNLGKDLSKQLSTLCENNDIKMHRILNSRDDTWCFTFWKNGVGSMKKEIDSFRFSLDPVKVYTELIDDVCNKFGLR